MLSGYPVKPRNTKEKATLEFSLSAKTKSAVRYESTYNPRDEAWAGKAGRPWNPGLVIYAHSDGGFSVWDPARNYWKKKGNVDVQERLPAYVFTASEVWDGLWVDEDGQRRTPICNGLLYDWASWIREKGKEADAMPTMAASAPRRGEASRLLVSVSLGVGEGISKSLRLRCHVRTFGPSRSFCELGRRSEPCFSVGELSLRIGLVECKQKKPSIFGSVGSF